MKLAILLLLVPAFLMGCKSTDNANSMMASAESQGDKEQTSCEQEKSWTYEDENGEEKAISVLAKGMGAKIIYQGNKKSANVSKMQGVKSYEATYNLEEGAIAIGVTLGLEKEDAKEYYGCSENPEAVLTVVDLNADTNAIYCLVCK
ncbi:hypothetical protein N9W79_02275 [bacterium]|nr:hypothetical protein [bacterium]